MAKAKPDRDAAKLAAVNAQRLATLPEDIQRQQLAKLETDPDQHKLVAAKLDAIKAQHQNEDEQHSAQQDEANQPMSDDAALAYAAQFRQGSVQPPPQVVHPQAVDYNRDGLPDRHANRLQGGQAAYAQRAAALHASNTYPPQAVDRNRDGYADGAAPGPDGYAQDQIGYRERLRDRAATEGFGGDLEAAVAEDEVLTEESLGLSETDLAPGALPPAATDDIPPAATAVPTAGNPTSPLAPVTPAVSDQPKPIASTHVPPAPKKHDEKKS